MSFRFLWDVNEPRPFSTYILEGPTPLSPYSAPPLLKGLAPPPPLSNLVEVSFGLEIWKYRAEIAGNQV